MHLFMNNQIIYSEANSIKIYHKTFMSKVLEVCNWIVSNLFSRIAKIFRLPVLRKISDNKVTTGLFKMVDTSVIRLLDILGAMFGLLLSSVLFLIISVLIKLDSPGPVFYTQLRIGRNRRKSDNSHIDSEVLTDNRNGDRRKTQAYGKQFNIYKFRTMRDNAEKKCGPVLASENDPRITKIGRLLRHSHLDELPQLVNILKGDLSFVGPKPERPYLVSQIVNQIPAYAERFRVRPGLTGLAQLKINSSYSFDNIPEKLEYDLTYCKNQGLKFYLAIIFLSITRFMSDRKKRTLKVCRHS